MPDFRSLLYDNYVTKFKKYYISSDPEIIKSDWIKYRKRIIPLLLDYGKNAEILEIGCGSGNMLEFLASEGFYNISGVDISEEQIETAKGKGLNVRTEDVFNFLEDKKKKFDIIIAFDFIEHFNKEELYKLISIIYQSLKDAGIVIIRTPNGSGIAPQKIIYGDLTHLTIFTPDSLFQLLKLVGFKEIKFWETGPIAKNTTGIIRLTIWNLIKLVYNFIRLIETGGMEKILTQDFICLARK